MKMPYPLMVCLLLIGCAHVQIEAPKEPIKMDINMRLDVYQHVAKDIDDIESIVSGSEPKKSLGDVLVPPAHADDLSPDALQAAYRRKARLEQIRALKSQGGLSEDGAGYLKASGGDSQAVADAENADRTVIYQSIATKNGTSAEEVRKIYAKKLA